MFKLFRAAATVTLRDRRPSPSTESLERDTHHPIILLKSNMAAFEAFVEGASLTEAQVKMLVQVGIINGNPRVINLLATKYPDILTSIGIFEALKKPHCVSVAQKNPETDSLTAPYSTDRHAR